MLVGRGLIDRTEKSPDDVFTIIEQDHHVAGLLYNGVRRAEWALRRLAVERYCDQFEPTQTFLDPNRYSETYYGSSRRLVEQMLDQILRYGEPYVSSHIDTVSRETGLPRHKSYAVEHHKACATLVKDLPLWAVVDCFSLGLLSRFITRCHSPQAPESPVWKAVAHDLDIPAQLFPTHIESLAVLRNLVAHHTRLWMRPTTSSPRKPKRYEKVLRGTDPKAMRVAFINVAMFQERNEKSRYLERIEAAIEEDPVYYYGVTKVHHHLEADR